jgi:hypothetical protein
MRGRSISVNMKGLRRMRSLPVSRYCNSARGPEDKHEEIQSE